MKKVYAIAALVNSGSAIIYYDRENYISMHRTTSYIYNLDDRLINYSCSRSESRIEIKESSVRTFFVNNFSLAVSTDVHGAFFFDTVEEAESRIEAILAEDNSLIIEIVALYK